MYCISANKPSITDISLENVLKGAYFAGPVKGGIEAIPLSANFFSLASCFWRCVSAFSIKNVSSISERRIVFSTDVFEACGVSDEGASSCP